MTHKVEKLLRRAEAAEARASDLQSKLDDAHDREAQIALQRNEWEARALRAEGGRDELAEALAQAVGMANELAADVVALEREASAHVTYTDCINGGTNGYRGACETCGWRGPTHEASPDGKALASRDHIAHMEHHPRVPDRPTVSTTDHDRTRPESSLERPSQDTGERDG